MGGDLDVYINMWDLLAFVLSIMHESVVGHHRRYAVIWAQGSDHRIWPWSAYRFKSLLPDIYAEQLEAVHVVHPSWTIRFLRLALWPIARDEFWDYFYAHERIEFLDSVLDLRKLELPPDLYQYDRYLDKQAQEASEQAARQMGHRYPSAAGF